MGGAFDSRSLDKSSDLETLGPQVVAMTSTEAQVDCSQLSATLQVTIENANGDLRVCIESTLNLPVGSARYGESTTCTDASQFARPDNQWVYHSSTQSWSKIISPLSSQSPYVPGTYRFYALDALGRIGKSKLVTISRPGLADCRVSSAPQNPNTGATGVPSNGFDPSSDRGFLKGTWIPSGTTKYWVVDQSNSAGQGSVTYFPGCVNQLTGAWSCPSNLGPINLYGAGTMLSIRYRTLAKTPEGSVLSIGAGSGTSAIPTALAMTLSIRPGDFSSAVPSACRASGSAGTNPRMTFGAQACVLTPNQFYYLNIKTQESCRTEGTCRFIVNEPSEIAN